MVLSLKPGKTGLVGEQRRKAQGNLELESPKPDLSLRLDHLQQFIKNVNKKQKVLLLNFQLIKTRRHR